jgi:hypothetical protein
MRLLITNLMTKQSSFKDYLDQCITKYFSGLISKYEFRVTSSYFEGLGALYEFQNPSFKLKIINDRDIINTDIASNFQPEIYKDVEVYNSLIQLKKVDAATVDEWKLKMIVTKRLSCEEQATFIDSEYSKLTELLNHSNYQKTLQEVEELQRKRFNYLFNTTGA